MKQIKGFVTYIYKGIQYFEQPSKTHISKIEYDSNENMSMVYLRHNTYFIEVLCIIVLCLTLYFVYNDGEYVQTIHVPSNAYYYDGKLYVNAVADENNSSPVDCSIDGYNIVLNPGESLEYIDYTYQNKSSEIIYYTINVLGVDRTFHKELTINILKVEEEGLYDEVY